MMFDKKNLMIDFITSIIGMFGLKLKIYFYNFNTKLRVLVHKMKKETFVVLWVKVFLKFPNRNSNMNELCNFSKSDNNLE